MRRDIDEAQIVRELIKKVGNIELQEASEISDRIAANQPFIMSLLMGYTFDVEGDQLDDIMKMLFVIYLFFESHTETNRKQIDVIEFEYHQRQNVKFLKYFSGEETLGSQLEANKQYLYSLKFKALFAGILVMSNTQMSFKRMSGELKGIIVLGMKTLVDCLEANLVDG